MKKLLSFLSILATLFCCLFWYGFTTTTQQDTNETTKVQWVRITNKNTWLYKNATTLDKDKLFVLEYSYYAKVKETTQNGFYYVEVLDNFGDFVKIFGYVLATQVKPQTETPLSPTYPTLLATVNNTNTILFSMPNATSQSVFVVYQGQILSYFGSYPTSDTTWYLVRMDQTLCYLNADNVSLPAVNLHPTPIIVQTTTEPEKEPTPPSQTTTQDTQNTIQLSKWQITLVATIALSAVVIVVILFLPAKSKKQKDFFYDLNDDNKNSVVLTEETSLRPRYFDDYL